MKAVIRVILLQAKDASNPPAAREDSWNRISFPIPRKNSPVHLDLGLLASRTEKSQFLLFKPLYVWYLIQPGELLQLILQFYK